MAQPGFPLEAEGEPHGYAPLTAAVRFVQPPPPLNVEHLAAELTSELGEVEVAEGLLVLHGLRDRESALPPCYLVLDPSPIPNPDPMLDPLRLTQLWRVGDRRDELICADGCRVVLLDIMGSSASPADRVRALGAVVQGVLRQWPQAVSVLFGATGDLYAADDLRTRATIPGRWRSLAANVRFFRVADSPTGDFVFDTLGLHALGLPEVQVHCRNLDPDDVAAFTRNTAIYLLEHGDVIEDGDTVDGIDGGVWSCRHEMAIIQPPRVVLDVHAGRYAAGDR